HCILLFVVSLHFLVGYQCKFCEVVCETLLLQKLEWFAKSDDIKMCKLKGKTEEDCQNYIRVLARKSETVIFVCGTNAYKPRCRDYEVFQVSTALLFPQDGEYLIKEDKPGEGLCPFDPKNNSTAIFAGPLSRRTDGDLYVATVGQLSGADPLIHRRPLRTEPSDLKHLNAPNFVSSIYFEDYVYFFFRESAVEYINCGKTVYSRVARVCTRDKGGPHKFQQRWTSFLKARLNCSVGGDIPFYFNEIQSTSPIVEGTYNGKDAKLIYSVFTTPHNSLSGSAVCAFSLEDVQRAFEGNFKGQDDINSNWLPIVNSKVPEPRPGQCVNDSRTLPDVTLNFITEHPLMDQAVPSYFGRPILVHTGFQYRFTYIAVDPQVETVNGKKYDVLFIGTDVGRVLKAVNVASSTTGGNQQQQQQSKGGPVLVEDVGVFESGAPVTNLLVHRNAREPRLIVVAPSEIHSIPLFGCQRYAGSCADCVALQDPYCAWDTDNNACVNPRLKKKDSFVQNIEEGWDHRCGQANPTLIKLSFQYELTERLNILRIKCRNFIEPVTMNLDFAFSCSFIMKNRNLQNLAIRQKPASLADNLFNSKAARVPQVATVAEPKTGAAHTRRLSSAGGVAGASLHGAQGGPSASSQFYTAETLAIAVTTSIVSSLVVGFISGYIFSRRCRGDEEADDACPADDYSHYLDRGGGGDPHAEGFLAAAHHHHHNNAKPINLVLNVPPKNGKNAN
ncbi:unnamed protein product, partial [Ixodes pacificus]